MDKQNSQSSFRRDAETSTRGRVRSPKHSRCGFSSRNIPKMNRENSTIEICPGITRCTVANGKTINKMLATLAAALG